MYIYYPSCNFQRYFPETADRIRSWMSSQSDTVIAGCCHVTSGLPKEDDIIVTVCLSCMRTMDEVRSDCKTISLFEYLLTRQDFQWPDLQGEEITLQDCFRARGKHELQESVRTCLNNCNVSVQEMEQNRDEEEFDGSFRFHDPYPQNQQEAPAYFKDYLPAYVTLHPKEEWPCLFQKHASLYKTKRVVCYCNTCTNAVKETGTDVFHLAELLFP